MARRYLKILFSILGLLVFLQVSLSLIVDPYGLFGTRLLPDSGFNSHQYRLGAQGNRVVKGLYLTQLQPEILFLGSSRVNATLNPDISFLEGHNVYNASVPGARGYELGEMARYAAANVPSVRHIIWGLDFDYFYSPEPHMADYPFSVFAGESRLSGYVRYLFSENATAGLFRYLARYLSNERLDNKINGFTQTREVEPIPVNQNDLFMRSTIVMLNIMTQVQITTRNERFERLDRLRETARQLHETGVRFTIFLQPAHIYRLQDYRLSGAWPAYEEMKRFLTDLTAEFGDGEGRFEFLDFGYLNNITSESVPEEEASTMMQWHAEASHYITPVGDNILARIFDQPLPHPVPGGFGVRPTQANIVDHLTNTRDGIDAWALDNPEFMTWLRQEWGKLTGDGAERIVEEVR